MGTSALPSNHKACADNGAPIEYSTFRNRTDTRPVRQRSTWGDLARMLTTHALRDSKDGAMFSPATFKPGTTRANRNVATISMMAHEFDHDVDLDAIRAAHRGRAYVVYSTHSSTPEVPRVRVVVPLARTVTPDEHDALWRSAQEHWYGGKADEAAKASSEAFYLPSHPQGVLAIAIIGEGDIVDPDELPAATRKRHAEPLPEKWPDTTRNKNMLHILGLLRGKGIPTEPCRVVAHALNETMCVEPLDSARIETMVTSSAPWGEPPEDDDEPGACGRAPCRDPRCKAEKHALRETHAATLDVLANPELRPGEKITAVAAILETASRQSRSKTSDGDGFAAVPIAALAARTGQSEGRVGAHLRAIDATGALFDPQKRPVEEPDPETGEMRPVFIERTRKRDGATLRVPKLTTWLRLKPATALEGLRVAATLSTATATTTAGAEGVKVRGTWGGLRHCVDHPTAAVEIRSFVCCAECGRPLRRTDEAADRNTQDALFDSDPTEAHTLVTCLHVQDALFDGPPVADHEREGPMTQDARFDADDLFGPIARGDPEPDDPDPPPPEHDNLAAGRLWWSTHNAYLAANPGAR